jgi:hypothetical protein
MVMNSLIFLHSFKAKVLREMKMKLLRFTRSIQMRQITNCSLNVDITAPGRLLEDKARNRSILETFLSKENIENASATANHFGKPVDINHVQHGAYNDQNVSKMTHVRP